MTTRAGWSMPPHPAGTGSQVAADLDLIYEAVAIIAGHLGRRRVVQTDI